MSGILSPLQGVGVVPVAGLSRADAFQKLGRMAGDVVDGVDRARAPVHHPENGLRFAHPDDYGLDAQAARDQRRGEE